jgi:hypothetical protein
MTRYLLSIQQPDGAPSPEVAERLPQMARDLETIVGDLKRAGSWVFDGGLHAPSTATVLRLDNGEVVMTDGPYTEGKEHIGGLVIVEAPDLDEAIGWARRFAEVIGLPIEVRPFADEG